jgi:hypothetical protein
MVIGVLRDLTQSFPAGCWYVMGFDVAGITAMRFAARRTTGMASSLSHDRVEWGGDKRRG